VVCLFLSNSARMANRDSRSARSSPANNCLRARKRRRYPESARRAVEDDMMKEVVSRLRRCLVLPSAYKTPAMEQVSRWLAAKPKFLSMYVCMVMMLLCR